MLYRKLIIHCVLSFKREVISAIFTEISNQEHDRKILFKDVEQYMLPKVNVILDSLHISI